MPPHRFPELRVLDLPLEYGVSERERAQAPTTFDLIRKQIKTIDVRLPSFYKESLASLQQNSTAVLRCVGPSSPLETLRTGFVVQLQRVIATHKIGKITEEEVYKVGYSSVKSFREAFRRRHPVLRPMFSKELSALRVGFIQFQVLEELWGLDPVQGIGFGFGTDIATTEIEPIHIRPGEFAPLDSESAA